MSHPSSSRRLVAWSLVVCATFGAMVAVAGAQAGSDPPSEPLRSGMPQAVIPNDHPCDLTAERSVQPLILEEGGELEVTASYDYRCPEGNRPVHFFLLVENSREMQREGYTGRQMLEHVREGLAKFVQQIDYEIGSQGGLILFNRTWTQRVPLRGEGGGRQALLAAIDTFPVGVGVNAASVGAAINEATRLLAAADAEGVTSMILIVQAGASLDNPEEDIEAACQAAKDAGLVVALLILEGVTEPLDACASPNWSRGAARPNGEDIPDTLAELGVAATRGHQALRVEYCDEVVTEFRFVEGSAMPRPPDSSALAQYCWVDDAPAPEGGHTVSYRLRAGPSLVNDLVKASSESLVRLTFADASDAEIRFDIPDVCVHESGRPEFCDPYRGTATSPSVTATATQPGPGASATPTRTATVASATAAASATPTEQSPTQGTPPTATLEAPPSAELYLPIASRRSAVGAGG